MPLEVSLCYLVASENLPDVTHPQFVVSLLIMSDVRARHPTPVFQASLVAQTVKNLPAMRETCVPSLGWKIPWRRAWQPTPVFLPGESHGQRSLAGYSHGVAEGQT